jgi:hypothetical protein
MEVIETGIVALIVLFSVFYSVWRLTSARFHLRAIDSLGSVLGKPAWLGRLRENTLSKLSGGCGSCASNIKPARRQN